MCLLIYYGNLWDAHCQSKVRVLETHAYGLPDLFGEADEKASTPVSEIDPAEFHDWVDARKPKLSVIEGDLRDAKRCISAAKGPRKKSKANGDGPAASSDGEDGGSHSVEDDD